MSVNTDIALAQRVRYADDSLAWKAGDKSEDELLQRIWNLASDVQLIAAALSRVEERTTTLEAERDEACADLVMLRDAWNLHFSTCSNGEGLVPTLEQVDAWRNAPSNTASAHLEPLADKAALDARAEAAEARVVQYEAALRMLWTYYLLPISDEQTQQVKDALGEA